MSNYCASFKGEDKARLVKEMGGNTHTCNASAGLKISRVTGRLTRGSWRHWEGFLGEARAEQNGRRGRSQMDMEGDLGREQALRGEARWGNCKGVRRRTVLRTTWTPQDRAGQEAVTRIGRD